MSTVPVSLDRGTYPLSPAATGIGAFATQSLPHVASFGEAVEAPTFAAEKITPIRERSDWLLGAYAELAALGRLANNWDGCGAVAPATMAVELAREVLQIAADFELAPCSIDASLDGGVCVSFVCSDHYADIECFNSGETLAVVSKGGEQTQVWAVDNTHWSITQAVKRIAGFLNRSTNS